MNYIQPQMSLFLYNSSGVEVSVLIGEFLGDLTVVGTEDMTVSNATQLQCRQPLGDQLH